MLDFINEHTNSSLDMKTFKQIRGDNTNFEIAEFDIALAKAEDGG